MSQPTVSHEDLVQRLEAVEAENRTLRRRLFESALEGVVDVPDNAAPIFESAHAAIDQLFQGFEADPARGRIDVSGQRYLLVRGAALSVEFFRMVRGMFGNAREEADAFAARMLYDLAHANGGHDATELHELLNRNTKVLVHAEEVSDRVVGVMGGYIRWAGLVEDPTQAIQVTERLSGRQLDPFAREVIMNAHTLR